MWFSDAEVGRRVEAVVGDVLALQAGLACVDEVVLARRGPGRDEMGFDGRQVAGTGADAMLVGASDEDEVGGDAEEGA